MFKRSIANSNIAASHLLRQLQDPHVCPKRCLQVIIPRAETYQSRPKIKLIESYIHNPSEVAFLNTTPGRLIDWRAQITGDKIGYVVPFQGVRKTFAQLNTDAEELASGLVAMGLLPGDRLGIWAPNSYQWMVTFFAASKAGLILVNVNPSYKVHELEYCMNKVQMKAIIAAKAFGTVDYYDYFEELFPDFATRSAKKLNSRRVPNLETIIMFDAKSPGARFPGTSSFEEVAEMRTKESTIAMRDTKKRMQTDDPFNIQFTSGTTGAPKGATLSSHGFINVAYLAGRRQKAGMDTFNVIIPLPLYHVFGLVNLVSGAIFGCKLVLPSEKFDAEATLKAIQDEQIHNIPGVPTMFMDMLNHPNFNQYNMSSLKRGFMGGAPCSPELIREVGEKMGLRHFSVGYGSTEQSASTFVGYPDEKAEVFLTTSGYPLDHVEAKVVNSEGDIVPIGQQGELWTRSFGTMLGYWDDAEKTKETILPDRWMPSGDVATLTEEGLVKIVGRVKDMIIRGGENVYPAEIENILLSCPVVADAHVCAVPDKRLGEDVCAWVLLKRGDAVEQTEEYLQEFCKTKLANYKVPKYFVFYKSRGEIPMTATGKIQKFKLTEMAITRLKL